MANYKPSDATKDKLILAFGLRAQIFKAAEDVAAARAVSNRELESAAISRLCFAVRAYHQRKSSAQTQPEKP